MPKKSPDGKKTSSWEERYDLPDELDFSKLRLVGVGVEALERHVAKKLAPRTVKLDADVAQIFGSEAEVNEALRLVKKMRQIGKTEPRRKTA